MKCYKKIVVDGSGNLSFFYPNIFGGIGYVIRRNRHNLIEDRISAGGEVKEFDLDIDKNDNIHLVVLNDSNQIVYYRYNLQEWKSQSLVSHPGIKVRGLNLKVLSGQGELHVFYQILSPRRGSILLHYCLSGGQWKKYRVVSINNGDKRLEFDISLDSRQKLYLTVCCGAKLTLLEFMYSHWEERCEIYDNNFSSVNTVILDKDYLVLGSRQEIYFIPNPYESNQCSPVHIVKSDYIEEGPVVINRKNTLYIAWIQGKRLNYRTSYDGGSSWSKVKEYRYTRSKEVELYRFCNNYLPFVRTKKVLGTKIPELHIPFINRHMERIRFPQKIIKGIKTFELIEQPLGAWAENESNGREQLSENVKGGINISEDFNPVDEILELKEKFNQNIKEIKDEMETVKKEISREIEQRFLAILEELKDIKKRLPRTPGNVITQQMINKHLKKNR